MKKTIYIIIIIILVMTTLGLGAFIAYDKLFVNTNKNTNSKETSSSKTEKTKSTEELDINDSTVQELFSTFEMTPCYMSVDGLNNDNRVRLSLPYDNIEYKNVYLSTCSDYDAVLPGTEEYCGTSMTKQMSDEYSKGGITEAFKEKTKYNNTRVIDQDKLEKSYKKLFGSNYTIKHESFGLLTTEPKCALMYYSSAIQKYVQYSGECGGSCGPRTQEITKAYKQNNKLYIETEYDDKTGKKTNINYEFKLENNNYTFVKAEEK